MLSSMTRYMPNEAVNGNTGMKKARIPATEHNLLSSTLVLNHSLNRQKRSNPGRYRPQQRR